MGNKEMSGFTLFAREIRTKSIDICINLNEIYKYKTINLISLI